MEPETVELAGAIERLTGAVHGTDPHPPDAAATLVNVGDLRLVLLSLCAYVALDAGSIDRSSCPIHGGRSDA